MILAPTSGPLGIQPHGHVARMVNRHSATLAVGDVVITSFAHSGVVFPATTVAQQSLTPFSNVILAEGDQTAQRGYIGVVADLGSEAGAVGTEVLVQFGGIARAKVTATATVSIGTSLGVHDSNGGFDTGGVATSTVPAAISLEALASGTSVINVWLPNLYWAQTATV